MLTKRLTSSASLVHICVLLPLAGVSAQAPQGRIERSAAAAQFVRVRRLQEKDGGSIWGVRWSVPLLFVDAASMEAAANQADAEGKLSRQGDIWTGKLPESVTPASSTLDWGGVRCTMVLWPVPELEHSRERLLMRESFHVIRNGLGLPDSNPSHAHLDDRDGRVRMRMEMRALAEALSRSGQERRRAVEDAPAFRAQRRVWVLEAVAREPPAGLRHPRQGAHKTLGAGRL